MLRRSRSRLGHQADDLLAAALDQAERARERGDMPFGAVLQFPDGRCFSAGNEVRSRRDPLAHAETAVIRAAIASGAERAPVGAILASSGEPCPMCFTTSRIYGIGSIVCITTMRDAHRAGFPTRALYRLFRSPRRARGVEVHSGRGALHERAIRVIGSGPSPHTEGSG